MFLVDLLAEHWIILTGLSIIGGLLFYGIVSISKYLSYPEVYLLSKSGRTPTYIGRKMSYKKKKDNDKVKGVMEVMHRGWLTNDGFTLKIPNSIDIEKRSMDKLVIRARNIRFEYKIFQSYIPTNKEFKSIHPDEAIFNNEISDKIKVTDSEVRKATNVNPEVSKHQKTNGSIPLSAQRESVSGFMDERLEEIGEFDESDDYSDESGSSGEDEKKSEEGYDREQALEDVEKIIQGS